ncbi:phosphonatase-like hydrolase [Tenacibaculum sp. MAR_2010_89]|uniref:phosphonatase-like hydrolase n=1 Tax=Tenacibaculum sp. MAR_2010_89 TaxID=1250198 RepID=UPI00351975D1
MMLKEIKMVVFDMAGTTVNEQNVVYKTLHKAIMEHGVEINLDLVLKIGAGKEKHQAIKDILKHIKSNKINESLVIFNRFKVLLNEAYENLNVIPIEGVEDVLLKIRNKKIKVVLNTGYSREIATFLLQKLKWEENKQYDLLLTATDVERGRPHPDMIYKAMKIFNIENSKLVLKAGDSAIDIEEGKNANCGITVGVLSGAQTKEQLESMNPDFIVNSLVDIDNV